MPDPNAFIPPGTVDSGLRPFVYALSRWLKGRLDALVTAGSNATAGFQGQLRAYAVPRNNENPTYQSTGRGQWLMSYGEVQVTTDANGYGTITFPVAFPAACVSVVAQIRMAGSSETVHNINSRSATNFSFRKAAATSTSVIVNYIAMGY